jgi:hypothetical protein
LELSKKDSPYCSVLKTLNDRIVKVFIEKDSGLIQGEIE